MPLEFDEEEVLRGGPDGEAADPFGYQTLGVKVYLRGRDFGEYAYVEWSSMTPKEEAAAVEELREKARAQAVEMIRWARQDFGEENEAVIRGGG